MSQPKKSQSVASRRRAGASMNAGSNSTNAVPQATVDHGSYHVGYVFVEFAFSDQHREKLAKLLNAQSAATPDMVARIIDQLQWAVASEKTWIRDRKAQPKTAGLTRELEVVRDDARRLFNRLSDLSPRTTYVLGVEAPALADPPVIAWLSRSKSILDSLSCMASAALEKSWQFGSGEHHANLISDIGKALEPLGITISKSTNRGTGDFLEICNLLWDAAGDLGHSPKYAIDELRKLLKIQSINSK